MGLEAAKNGVGMSFWVCRVESLLDSIAKTGSANVACSGSTHNLHLALACVSNTQGEGSLQTGLVVLQQDKRLVWSLRLAIVLCSQEDGEGILGAERDWGRERLGRSETGCKLSALWQLK